MLAMAPLLDYVFGLEGFEWVAFWLGLLVAYLIVGYFLDVVLRDLGLGPFINGLVVFAAVFFGVYLRYNYFRVEPWFNYEPYVTLMLCVAPPTLALALIAILRSRAAY